MVAVVYELGAMVRIQRALNPEIIQTYNVLSLSEVNSSVLLRGLMDLPSCVQASGGEPVAEIVDWDLAHLLILYRYLSLHLPKMASQVAAHLEEVGVVVKEARALVFARVASDVLRSAILVAVRMPRRSMQILQASFVSSRDDDLASYRHLCATAANHPLLLALILCALVVHVVHLLQLWQEIASVQVLGEHHVVELGEHFVITTLLIGPSANAIRKVVCLVNNEIWVVLVQVAGVDVIVVGARCPLTLQICLMDNFIMMGDT